MKLPHAERVVIDSRKLKDYALAVSHPVGRFKAAFFARLGFTPENWGDLKVQLRHLALERDAELGERSAYGQKYVVKGRVTGPKGRTAQLLTVWIVLNGQDVPQLVTLYPEG